jgi:hypothetical protein
MLDAIRTSDGRPVMLKQVQKSQHPYEAPIVQYLNSPGVVEDPRNHAVRIHDVLPVPGNDDEILIVMDLLRKYDDPKFETIGEAVDFFGQIFEASNPVPALNIVFELLSGFAISPRASNCSSVYTISCYIYTC